MDMESKVIIPCKMPGLTCCIHQLVALNAEAENVRRCEVWCMKWRENHIKDKIYNACDKDYQIHHSQVPVEEGS